MFHAYSKLLKISFFEFHIIEFPLIGENTVHYQRPFSSLKIIIALKINTQKILSKLKFYFNTILVITKKIMQVIHRTERKCVSSPGDS